MSVPGLKDTDLPLYAALLSAVRVVKKVKEETGVAFTTDDIRAIAITRYIEHNRSGK